MLKSTYETAKLQDFFERTYIINLPSRADRRQEMISELAKVRMSLTPGKVEFFSAIRPEAAHAFPNEGVLGCYLSHVEILKQAQREGLSNVLVLEDDVSFTSTLVGAEAYLIRLLSQSNWSIVHPGFGVMPGYSFQDYYGDSLKSLAKDHPFLLKRCEMPFTGSHFYGVNGKVLGPLIDFLESSLEERLQEKVVQTDGPFGLDKAYIDTALYLFGKQYPGAISLIACPNLAVQRSSRSDISPGKLDWLPLPSAVINTLRSAKRRLLR